MPYDDVMNSVKKSKVGLMNCSKKKKKIYGHFISNFTTPAQTMRISSLAKQQIYKQIYTRLSNDQECEKHQIPVRRILGAYLSRLVY